MRVLPLCVLAAALALAGAAPAAQEETFRVGLVTEPQGVNVPIYRLMRDGLERAVRELGVQGRVLTPSPREGYLPSFLSFARQNYDLVIAPAGTQIQALDAAARRFPQIHFVLLDNPHTALSHRPKNVAAVVFAEQEIGYLTGYLAALMESRGPGKHVISSVGGFKYAPVDRFIAGYQAGARKADPQITTLNAYAFDFLDRAKCRQAALAQIAKGSGVVFQVAGACGLGALEAAKANGVWGIGVDIDQSFLGKHILTSATKRFDVAVFDLIREARRGRFEGGRTKILRLRDGALDLGRISAEVPRSFVARIERVRRQIVSGRIGVPRTIR
jgi:basic membrane protein A